MKTPMQVTKHGQAVARHRAERIVATVEVIPDRSIRKARPIAVEDDDPEVVPGLCRRCQSRAGFIADMCLNCGGRYTRDGRQ